MSTSVTRVIVGRSADVPEGGRLVAEAGGVTFGVFRFQGGLTAFENVCPHQGGPVCQGALIHGVQENLGEHRVSLGQEFDQARLNLVCPWHGYEFDVSSGLHAGARGPRLRRLTVLEEDGVVYLDL